MKERLDKFVSSRTTLSRKDVQRALRDKRVTLNGEVVRSGDIKTDTQTDTVTLDGKVLNVEEHVYYMLNKPEGYVSATEDSRERTVLELLPEELRRKGLFPAGRLDKDTTGLLIITDDGDYAHRMLSPSRHVTKRYIAELDKEPGGDIVSRFMDGITLSDGTVCKSAVAEPLGEKLAAVEISEGKYHQVKRMFAAAGYRVEKLKRVRIGALKLDESLAPGKVKKLSKAEADTVFDEKTG